MDALPYARPRLRKYQRMYFLILLLTSIGGAMILVLLALEDNLVFFYTPSELQNKSLNSRYVRLGGQVELGSVWRQGTSVSFNITDSQHKIAVIYDGVLPGLFRESEGVVVEGIFEGHRLRAYLVLAKHDENYSPPT